MVIPATLHLTSRAVPLRGIEAALLRGNRRVLAGWDVRIHSDADNDRLMGRTAPQHLEAYRSLPHGVMRADVARLAYMHAYGGWYSDTDYEWLREPSSDMRHHALVLPLSREGATPVLGNAVFGSVPGHYFWRIAIDHIFSEPISTVLPVTDIEATTGPRRLTGLIDVARAEGAWLAPRIHFHTPVAEARQDDLGIFGVHHTRGSWRERAWWWRLAMLRRMLSRRVSGGRRSISPG